MALLSRQPWCLASALLVPLLTLASPGWLKIGGVPPAWSVLWLLPWSLVEGRVPGLAAGIGLGLLLDGLHPGVVTQIPALALLGWWWGRFGRKAPPLQRSFGLALLAMVGTLALNLTLMAQWALLSLQATAGAALPFQGADGGGALRVPQEAGVSAALLALPGWHGEDLAEAGLHVLLAQILLTSLLAPLLCSLQLLLWRQLASGGRG